MSVSPLHMPDAPPQPEWQPLDHHQGVQLSLEQYLWDSALLRNQRNIRIYQTGEPGNPLRPLVLLLDGQFWAGAMPIASPCSH